MSTSKFTKNEYTHYERDHPTRIYSSPEEEEANHSSITTKGCSKCKQVKLLICFNGNTSGRDGFTATGYRHRRPECSTCTKAAQQGMKVAKSIAKKQKIPYKAPVGTPCTICKRTDRRMVFDHCHEKEVFRGYLCDPCNRSIGVLGDNIDGLLRCINYLQTTEQKIIIQDESGKLTVSK